MKEAQCGPHLEESLNVNRPCHAAAHTEASDTNKRMQVLIEDAAYLH